MVAIKCVLKKTLQKLVIMLTDGIYLLQKIKKVDIDLNQCGNWEGSYLYLSI